MVHDTPTLDDVREYLPTFLATAAEEGMADLARSASRLGSSPPPFAIVGGNLIDGTGAPAVGDAVIVVQGDRIVAAGPRKTTPIPRNTPTVDARGRTILPGLWDMHAHHDQVDWGPAYLAAGVTTVRDCGNLLDFTLSMRRAIQSGGGLGPSLLLAGLVDGVGPRAMGPIRATSHEDARAFVNRFKQG